MEHDEIESLLGAFALDAVSSEEAIEIEHHLSSCPRCRSELEAHREVVSRLGNEGDRAPEGLWEQIADQLVEKPPKEFPELLGELRARQRDSVPRSLLWKAAAALAAVAAAVVVVMGLRIASLNHQLHRSATVESALASGVRSVTSGPHSTIRLVSATHATVARIVVDSSGDAYWTGSTLRTLSSSNTYQLWALSSGRVVSLGVLGPNPKRDVALRLQRNMRVVMVTEEPQGGTTLPSSMVLAKGDVASF